MHGFMSPRASRHRLYSNPLSICPCTREQHCFCFTVKPFLIGILYATDVIPRWQSALCLEANAWNKKWFPYYGNQSNVINDQHILTQRQRGEECPIDWYCLLGCSRWSLEEKTSVAGGPQTHPPPICLPTLCLLPSIYVSILWGFCKVGLGGGWGRLCVCIVEVLPGDSIPCWWGRSWGGWKDGAVTCQTAGMLMPWLW